MSTTYPGDTAWPTDYDGCALTGRFVDMNGTPITGYLTISMTPDVVFDYAHNTVIVKRDIVAELDSDGHFEITVPASDDPDITPNGWTYHVVESWDGGRQYDIIAPAGQIIDITDVSPLPSFGGTSTFRGPPGPTGSVTVGSPVSYSLISASTWTQTHTFAYLPEVRLITASGLSVAISVEYPDSSTVHISFPTPFTGTAILS